MNRETLILIAIAAVVPTAACFSDYDDDGHPDWGWEDDCDDHDPSVYPGAPDVCDGLDNDCDGLTDEEGLRVYVDGDRDGVGTSASAHVCSLQLPEGYAFSSGDCDDSDAAVRPGATDSCDGRDNDCDGDLDEGTAATWYRDADDDGLGSPTFSIRTCEPPGDYVAVAGDCDDTDPDVPADGPDQCDPTPRDTDCSGAIECPMVSTTPFVLAEHAEPIGGTSVAPIVPVALSDPLGLVVFRARLSGTSVESYATFGAAPVTDLAELDETTAIGTDSLVRAALEWVDVDDDGDSDVAAVVERDDGHAVVLLSGAALRSGGDPVLFELLTAEAELPGLTIGPTAEGGPALVVHRARSEVLVFAPDASLDPVVPSATWALTARASVAGSAPRAGRLVVLIEGGGGDELLSFASAEASGLADADGERALDGGSLASTLVAGPRDPEHARDWMFTVRRVPTGMEVAWVLDTLVPVGGEAVLDLPDAGGGPPVAAWAGVGGRVPHRLVGSAGALYRADWNARPSIRFAPVSAPGGVTAGRRLIRLADVGPNGADGIFVDADGGGQLGWVLWAE